MYHFIGIGGIGMSGLARLLMQKGEKVSGSDITDSQVIESLSSMGAKISIGHSKEHIPQAASVVFSTDIKEDNPEWISAKERGLTLMHRSKLLAMLMKDKKALLVSGTHGKTTTSSLLAHVIVETWANTCFAIGGIVKKYGVNSLWSQGEYFVAEADESDGSFLEYFPHAAIITNIDLDHLAHWQNEQNLLEGFTCFANKVPRDGYLLWCKDDKRLSSLSLQGISYGFSDDADARLLEFRSHGLAILFTLEFRGVTYKDIHVPLLGRHNALNAAAVFALALSLGLHEKAIRKALLSFEGVRRRSDYLGDFKKAKIYDDYGHHPEEIKATLEAFKAAFPGKRLVTVFQPHRYTRTRDCLDDFSKAFCSADIVILTDIYSAGEAPIEGVDSTAIFDKVKQFFDKEVFLIKKEFLKEYLQSFLQPEDILLTMGAGDVTKIGPALIDKNQE